MGQCNLVRCLFLTSHSTVKASMSIHDFTPRVVESGKYSFAGGLGMVWVISVIGILPSGGGGGGGGGGIFV